MRNRSTIEYLGLREQLHNLNFKPIEFDRFKIEAGGNSFALTPQQWIKATDAELIKDGLAQQERFEKLRSIAYTQMSVLQKNRDKENKRSNNITPINTAATALGT